MVLVDGKVEHIIRKGKRYFNQFNSIFKDYVDDNPKLIKKCSDNDINYSNIRSIFSDEREKITRLKNII